MSPEINFIPRSSRPLTPVDIIFCINKMSGQKVAGIKHLLPVSPAFPNTALDLHGFKLRGAYKAPVTVFTVPQV